VEKRVGEDRRSGIELRAIKGANFHARDLLLRGCFRLGYKVTSGNALRFIG
jgi:hypothetical protein